MSERQKFYAEQWIKGRWTPVTFAAVPNVKHGRVAKANCVGHRLRKMRDGYVREINPGHVGLPLDSLHARYSPDGRFQATEKGAA